MKILVFTTLLVAIALVEAKKAADQESAVVEETKSCSKTKYNKYEAETHVKRCPPGWSRYRNDKCFKIITTEALVNHDAAQAACQLLGSTLASITNSSELTFLESLLLRESVDETNLKSLWIGLRRKFNKLIWYDLTDNGDANNVQVPSVPATVVDAVTGLTVNLPTDCGSIATDSLTMTNDTANFGKVVMTNCDELKGYVCQKVIIEKQGCCS